MASSSLVHRNLTSIYMKYRSDHRHKKNRFAGSFLTENTSARLLAHPGGHVLSSQTDVELDVSLSFTFRL